MNYFSIIISRLKEYGFVLFPLIVGLAVLNVYIYYSYFFSFDIIPYINISDSLLFSLFSIGNFSLLQLLLYFLFCFVIISTSVFEKSFSDFFTDVAERHFRIEGSILNSSVIRSIRENNMQVSRDKLLNLRNSRISSIEISDLEENDKRVRIAEINDDYNETIRELESDYAKFSSEMENFEEKAEKERIAHLKDSEPLNEGHLISVFRNINFEEFSISKFSVFVFLHYIVIRPIILIFYIFIINLKNDVIFSNLEFWIIFLSVGMLIFFVIRKSIDSEITFRTSQSVLVATIMLLVSNQIANTLQLATEVKHNLKYKGTEISTEHNIYKSSDTLTYVGRTRDFVFFYHLINKSTTVIPIDDIVTQTYISK